MSGKVFIGSTVTGWIREVDPQKKRLSLSLREVAANDPWESAATKYAIGRVVEGTIDHGGAPGIFVQLEPGLVGPPVLSWEPVLGVAKYRVTIKVNGGNLTGTPVDTYATSYTPSGLVSGETYQWYSVQLNPNVSAAIALVILGIRDQHTFPLIFVRENCADAGLTGQDWIAETEAEPRYLVPVGGMVIGNSMTAAAVALNRLADEMRAELAAAAVRAAAARDRARRDRRGARRFRPDLPFRHPAAVPGSGHPARRRAPAAPA